MAGDGEGGIVLLAQHDRGKVEDEGRLGGRGPPAASSSSSSAGTRRGRRGRLAYPLPEGGGQVLQAVQDAAGGGELPGCCGGRCHDLDLTNIQQVVLSIM